MKKKSLLSIFFIVFPLLIAIGFSTWIIIYEVIITPSRVSTSPISDYFGITQETIYNSEEQVPTQQSGDPIDTSLITYQYKLKSDTNENNYVEGKPIDAGVYDVKVIVENLGECKVLFTIHPKKIRLQSSTFEIPYDEKYTSWAQMQLDLNNMISFVDENNVVANELVTGDYKINGMHNGVYYYGTLKDTTGLINASDKKNFTSHIIGSTYTAQVELHEDLVNNYEFLRTPTCIIKYQTAIVNGTYYTIEDALINTSANIVLCGTETTATNQFVLTCFSKILSTNTYELQNRKLTVPNNASAYDYKTDYTDDSSSNVVYSALEIPLDITLNIKNNATMVVSSLIKASANVTRRGVVVNNGIINVYSGCYYKSYGFTKGTGILNLYEGSEALDIFRIYDWPGADEALNLKNANAFPVLQWSAYNISCIANVYHNAKYNSFSYVVVASGLGKIEINDVYIIGDQTTQNCLFKPTSNNSKNNFIQKSANILDDSIVKTNQTYATTNIIDIYGSYMDAVVKLNIKYLFFNYSFETSTTMAIPIGYFNINIKENSNMSFSASSYVLKDQTANITIENNANLSINGSAYIAFMNGSTLIVNGTLSGTGSIGGIIQSNLEEAMLSISTYGINNVILKTSSTTSQSYSVDATGNIGNNGVYQNSLFTTGNLYYSEKATDQQFYFVAGTNINTFTINYVTNGGGEMAATLLRSFNDTYEVNNSMISTPKKLHYDFVGWYTDESLTNIFTNTTLTNDKNSITLYANWTPHTYSFSYTAGYGTTSDGNINYITDNVIFQNKLENFTIEDFSNGKLSISTLANYNGKNFNGWYIGIDNSTGIKFSEITISQLEMFVEEFGDTMSIPLYCYFSDEIEYTIQFVDNNDENSDPQSTTIIGGNTITLPSLDRDFNNDEQYNKYFVGWYATANYDENSLFDASTLVDGTYANANNVITLYAKWDNKYSLNVHTNNTSTFYYMPNTSVNLNLFDTNKEGHTFNSWYDNESYSGTALATSITITENMDVYAKYSVNSYKISISGSGNQTVTITANGQTINNGDYIEYGTKITIQIGRGTLFGGTTTVKVSTDKGVQFIDDIKNGIYSSAEESFDMPAYSISIVIS